MASGDDGAPAAAGSGGKRGGEGVQQGRVLRRLEDRTAARIYLSEPVWTIHDLIWSRYHEAAAAVQRHPETSPHRQEWSRRADLMLRAAGAWAKFMEQEGLADGR